MDGATILVVDDEETVRKFIRNVAGMRGYRVLEAGDGHEAMQVAARHPEAIDLLLTDIRMPRMDGVELSRSFGEAHPETPVLYMSGYPFDVEQERHRAPLRFCAFLAKPFTPKVLLETVNQCLSSSTQNAPCA